MATFKVGQRVKHTPGDLPVLVPVGAEGTIAGSSDVINRGFRYHVAFDGLPCPTPPGTYWYCKPEWLIPLTDPGADAWASEQVRKWTKPEPVTPVVVKEKA